MPLDATEVTFTQTGTGAVQRSVADKLYEEISILDYLDGDDVYAALLAAIDKCRQDGGGTILIPARLDPYDIDPSAPIEIDFSNLCIRGQGASASVLHNVSTTGVDLFLVTGAIREKIELGSTLKLQSGSQAGHILTFEAEAGLVHSRIECAMQQRNPAKSIIDADFSESSGGLFNNLFDVRDWDHGTGVVWGQQTAPSVPAINISGNNNRMADNVFAGPMRLQCHFGTVPFVRLNNYGADAWFYQTVFRDVQVERPRGGVFELSGCFGTVIDGYNVYDAEDIDGHLIEMKTGAGGKACEQTSLKRVKAIAGVLVGVAGTEKSVSGITRNGQVATVSCTNHGYPVGKAVEISGADQSEYNGRKVISAVTANTFDVPVSGTPATPATGTIESADAAMDVLQGPDDSMIKIEECGGTGGRQQWIDLRNRGGQVDHYTASRTTLCRVSATQMVLIGAGGSAGVQAPVVQAPGGGPFDAPGGVILGSAGKIVKLLDVSQALNFPSIAAQSTAEMTVTVTGAAQGDEVVANPNSLLETGLILALVCVSSADTVTIRLTNITAAAIDPANRTWKVRVYKH